MLWFLVFLRFITFQKLDVFLGQYLHQKHIWVCFHVLPWYTEKPLYNLLKVFDKMRFSAISMITFLRWEIILTLFSNHARRNVLTRSWHFFTIQYWADINMTFFYDFGVLVIWRSYFAGDRADHNLCHKLLKLHSVCILGLFKIAWKWSILNWQV